MLRIASDAKRRNDIDGLRATAVGAVLLYHAFPGELPGGYLGVDIFFTISGYLITRVIFDEIEREKFSLLDFYSRRARRILPSLIIVCASCLLFGWYVLLPDELMQIGRHALASMMFVQNIALFREVGYFDVASYAKPLLHLWSLAVEEQFYIVFPLAVFLLLKTRFRIHLAIGALLLISLGACIHAMQQDPSAAFYLPQFRAWELLAGAMLAGMAGSKLGAQSRWICQIASLSGALLVGVGILTVGKDTAHPGLHTILPILGTVLLIGAGDTAVVNKALLSNRLFVWSGLISYPLYLWHWPILSFGRIIDRTSMTWQVEVACLAVSVMLAWLTYVLVEKPIRLSKWPSLKQKASVLAISSLIVGCVGLVFFAKDGLPQRSSIAPVLAFNEAVKWPYSTNDTCLKNFDYPDRKGVWWFCIAENNEPTVLLLGNSFANHLYPGLINNESFAGVSFISIGACDPASAVDWGIPENDISPCAGRDGLHEAEFINQFVARQKSLKYVILNTFFPGFDSEGRLLNREGSLSSSRLTIFDDATSRSRSSFQNYFTALDTRISFLEKQGLTVILFEPKPELGTDIRNCIERPFKPARPNCSVSADAALRSQAKVRQGLATLIIAHPKMRVFDQFPAFCNAGVCDFLRQVPVLRDATHLSAYGSSLVASAFAVWLRNEAPDFFDKANGLYVLNETPK